jgi:hypothetical protein
VLPIFALYAKARTGLPERPRFRTVIGELVHDFVAHSTHLNTSAAHFKRGPELTHHGCKEKFRNGHSKTL